MIDMTKIEAGTLVDVTRDNGTTIRTKTRSTPWQLGHGAWVVLLEAEELGGGGFSLNRCRLAVDFLEIPAKRTRTVLKLLQEGLRKIKLDPETEAAVQKLYDGYVKEFLGK